LSAVWNVGKEPEREAKATRSTGVKGRFQGGKNSPHQQFKFEELKKPRLATTILELGAKEAKSRDTQMNPDGGKGKRKGRRAKSYIGGGHVKDLPVKGGASQRTIRSNKVLNGGRLARH